MTGRLALSALLAGLTACAGAKIGEESLCPEPSALVGESPAAAEVMFSSAVYYPESYEFVDFFADLAGPPEWLGYLKLRAWQTPIIAPAGATTSRCLTELDWIASWGHDGKSDDLEIYAGELAIGVPILDTDTCGTVTLSEAVFGRPTDGSVLEVPEVSGSLSCWDGYWGEPVLD